jgi:putative salt-induced outer membrane protein YdiY
VGGRRRLVCTGIALVWLGATAVAAQDAPAQTDAPTNPWGVKAALSGSLRTGDEDKGAANGDVEVGYKFNSDSLTFRALGDYGVSNGSEDTKDASGSLTLRHDFTHRFFGTAKVYADTDPIQNRELRFIVDAGPGYRIWEQNDKEFFEVSSGVGYRADRFKAPTPDDDFLDLRASYRYHDKIGDALEISHATDFSFPANQVEDFLVKSELTLSVPLLKGFFLRNNLRLEYDNRPALDKKSTNLWLTLGLEYRWGDV